MNKVITDVVPDTCVAELHGVDVLRLQEMAVYNKKRMSKIFNKTWNNKTNCSTGMHGLRRISRSQHDRILDKSTTTRLTCIQSSSFPLPSQEIEGIGIPGI